MRTLSKGINALISWVTQERSTLTQQSAAVLSSCHNAQRLIADLDEEICDPTLLKATESDPFYERAQSIQKDIIERRYRVQLHRDVLVGKYYKLVKALQTVDEHAGRSKMAYEKLLKHNLGYKRESLPQINDKDVNKFKKAAENAGVSYSVVKKKIKDLKPTQSDFDKGKIKSMLSNAADLPLDDYIIGNDNHLLDRQHRWATMLELNPDAEVDCIQFDCTTPDLIKMCSQDSSMEKFTKALLSTPLDRIAAFVVNADQNADLRKVAAEFLKQTILIHANPR